MTLAPEPVCPDDDLLGLVGLLFERAFTDPELRARLAGTGVVLELDCEDLGRPLVLDLPNGRVQRGAGGLIPTARMEMCGADLNRYLQEDLNLTLAIAEGHVRVYGAIARVLVAAPQVTELSRVYRDLLVDQGRADLLV